MIINKNLNKGPCNKIIALLLSCTIGVGTISSVSAMYSGNSGNSGNAGALEQTLKTLNDISCQYVNLEEQCEQLRKENSRMSQDLEIRSNENVALNREISRLRTENNDIRGEITRLENSLNKYTQELERLRKENSELRVRLENPRMPQVVDPSQEIARLRQENEKLLQQLNQLREEREQNAQVLSQQQATNEELTQQLNQLKVDNSRMTIEIDQRSKHQNATNPQSNNEGNKQFYKAFRDRLLEEYRKRGGKSRGVETIFGRTWGEIKDVDSNNGEEMLDRFFQELRTISEVWETNMYDISNMDRKTQENNCRVDQFRQENEGLKKEIKSQQATIDNLRTVLNLSSRLCQESYEDELSHHQQSNLTPLLQQQIQQLQLQLQQKEYEIQQLQKQNGQQPPRPPKSGKNGGGRNKSSNQKPKLKPSSKDDKGSSNS